MSSQGDESSSERNDGTQPINEGVDRSEPPEMAAGAADNRESAQNVAGQQHPQPPPLHQGPQDLFGMLANILPQAMEGIVNSMLNGGGARQGEQGAAPNEQAPPPPPHPIPPMAGIERFLDMMRQQQQIWENVEDRIDEGSEERRRRADEARMNNDPIANIFAQLGGVMENLDRPREPDGHHLPRPAATAAPINLIQEVTAAVSGLAGTAPGGNGQSFMERLQAATAAGAAQAGTSNQQPPRAPGPPPQAEGGEQPQRHVFELPQFGGARIEIVGLPGNLNEMLRQLRGRFDPTTSSGSRISDEDLARLPNSKVRQSHVDDEKQCFICMDQYTEVGAAVAELNCAHVFHVACITPWLKRNTTCPVCRAEVVSRNWIHEELELD